MFSGRMDPWWHVKQLTRGCPPKYMRLMLFIIATIPRARVIDGVVMANASRSL